MAAPPGNPAFFRLAGGCPARSINGLNRASQRDAGRQANLRRAAGTHRPADGHHVGELLQDNSFEGLREFSDHTIAGRRVRWITAASGGIPVTSCIRGAPSDRASTQRIATNIRHGMQAKMIANRGEKPSGIAQDGIPMRAGMTYRFTGYLSPGPRGTAGETAGHGRLVCRCGTVQAIRHRRHCR